MLLLFLIIAPALFLVLWFLFLREK